ncbi:MAG TPA: methionyl-tRNA formyltransferase [Candidatus Saccharimonadia bacterium]|nr:methionyl-tRNA formyltransferase [Candidatus Saccharimonadia bacterium]
MKILLVGTPKTTVIVGEALLAAGHSIEAVVSPFPKPVGRKKVVTASELEQWAHGKNLPVFQVDKLILNGDELATQLPFVDVMVVADFGFLIPAWLLNFPKGGGLNVHPSMLPRWRGASPVPFTLLFGDKMTGVTIIKMNEQFDKGEIVAQKAVEIEAGDTTPTLLRRAFVAGAELLVEILPDYVEGAAALKPQIALSPTPVTRKFTKDDGFVPYEALEAAVAASTTEKKVPMLEEYHLPSDAQGIDRMVRALSPWPGVWTMLPNGKRMKLLESEFQKDLLHPKKIQLEGKNPTSWTPSILEE